MTVTATLGGEQHADYGHHGHPDPVGGIAADPGDYAVTTALGSVTIPAGQASGSGMLTLTPVSDAVVEGDETIVIDGAVAGFTVSLRHHHPRPTTTTATLSVNGPTSAVNERARTPRSP